MKLIIEKEDNFENKQINLKVIKEDSSLKQEKNILREAKKLSSKYSEALRRLAE